MKKRCGHILLLLFLTAAPHWIGNLTARAAPVQEAMGNVVTAFDFQQDTTLRYPFADSDNYPYSGSDISSPLYLNTPSNIKREVVYDPETGKYIFQEKVGNWYYRKPTIMTKDQFIEYQYRKSANEYWRMKQSGATPDQPAFIPTINLGGEAFDKVFGSNTINIEPSGNAELIFGYNYSRIENPNINEQQQRNHSFQFDEKIVMNVSGSIGEKLALDFSYNTEATFDFEQKTKLEYAGEEDEIIKKIEAGNVNLPLPGSLITGSQSLFGLKTEMQFGKLTVTSVFSQQRGESQVIEASGGAQVSEFEVTVDDYDANKHFFLSDYFRDNYNDALSLLPVVTSDVTITKIEVWVTNKTTNFQEARNILAVSDLAEADPNSMVFEQQPVAGDYPRNELNNAYEQLTGPLNAFREIKNATSSLENAGLVLGRDFEKIENARMLSSREFSFHPKLGYISLNSALNTDEVLAVAYEYTYNGRTYQVGELSASSGITAPQTLLLKLVKPSNFTPRSYTWDLMMKNVYAIGAYQVKQENFILDVTYRDDKTGNLINYLPEGKLNKYTLIDLLDLDNLDSQRDPYPDGVFDYLANVTIIPSSGRIIFPLLEPFGSDLKRILEDSLQGDAAEMAINKYVYQELYDSTKTKAQQIAEKNKFMLTGEYSSSGTGSEIMLNAMNVPEGSVKVTAGGRELIENQDYTVDYTLGRVTIINQGILESGTPVRISLENQSLFNFQTKTMVGSHLDYKISDNFNMGATVLHLSERPLTQKVNIGDEPISNTIWGLNGSYSTQSQFLTNMVDKIPFIETKVPSQITLVGEFAHLIPGHSRAIDKEGNAYIDDFEGSETSIDMKYYTAWHLASTPRGFFSEAELNNNRDYGRNRAKLAWYQIDPLFLRNRSTTPLHLKENPDAQSSPYVYEVFEQDLFPNKELQNGIPSALSILNLAYYPRERGPYNYDVDNIDEDGFLQNPESRWGGIMRDIYSTDFEAANVEFIEFWLMDPYAGMEDRQGGQLYFNLGNISEDILKDSRKMFENGLPSSSRVEKVDTTAWGRVPVVQSLVNAFNSDPSTREFQDVGLDGLSDEDERSFFAQEADDFLNRVQQLRDAGTISQEAYDRIMEDPSSDNYNYFRDSEYDVQELGILDRYKKFNNPEGNSPAEGGTEESYSTSGDPRPDIEDLNQDNTLSETESYFYYRVDLSPDELEVGRNYIVDKVVDEVEYNNGVTDEVTWYQFRIPVFDYEGTVGDISDFKTIRFMRMFLTGFSDTLFLRFAKLEFIRGEWRRYNLPFIEGGEDWTGIEPPEGTLSISAVNIEENSAKEPVNYTLPPGFDRQIDPTQPQLRQLNEQSIVLKVNNLGDGDARAAYKNTELDIRQYRKIKMVAHAEALKDGILQDKELAAFIRLGSDYKGNFYEYEVPLVLTPPGRYDNESESDRQIVWPEENEFEIELDLFTEVKQERNRELADPTSNVSVNSVYFSYDDKGNKVSVSGNPNLANIRTIMIGVRNPKQGSNTNGDDGLPKSGEVWLNELRLTDFDESGGWAANGRASVNLADFGNITMAGSTSTPGFGSLDQKVNERSREQVIQYDLSSNFELGKFFKEEAGVSVPLYVGYSKSIINPEYNPLEPDIPLKEALDEAVDEAERDSIRRFSQDLVERKSFALTNMRVMGSGSGQPKIYSLSNWTASISHNETRSLNPNITFHNALNTKANISYNYNTRPKNVQPFKNVGFLSNKWLRLVKDFNFNYLPSQLAFRSDFDREYREKKNRNINNPEFLVQENYKKDFFWDRMYDLKFDITRSLKFDFSATNTARIDEPQGRFFMDSLFMFREQYDYREELFSEIGNLGRTTSYFHKLNLSYTLPINKIPLLDWVTMNARFNGTYGWDAGPIIPDIDLGNTIKNSYTLQGNGQLNFVNLYNKVGFLKDINDKYRSARTRQNRAETRIVEKTYRQDNLFMRDGRPRYVMHNLKTEDIEVTVYDENGREVEHELEIQTDRRIRVTVAQDIRNGGVLVVGKIEKGENPLTFIMESSVRMLMSVRTLNLTFQQSGGSLLPGYNPGTVAMGLSRTGSGIAPGLNYIAGWYGEGFAEQAFYNGWLTTDQNLNDAFNQNSSTRFNYRANVEPFPGLRIDVTGNMTYSENESEFYTADYDEATGEYFLPPEEDRGRVFSGNFSTSYLSWGTAFEPIRDTADISESFTNLQHSYRRIISERRANNYFENSEDGVRLPQDSGYYEGYGPTSQDVMIPAFLAAYGYHTPESVPLKAFTNELFRALPMPNWKVTFDGLGKIEALKEVVNSITLSHSYRSTYSVGEFVNNPFYVEEVEGVPVAYDLQGNFIVDRSINAVTISEQFSPLINLNMDWKNSLTTRVEIRKSRTVGLNLTNSQVNEVRSNELIIGAGYRFNEVEIEINQRPVTSDLNVRIDLSYRDNQTVIRKLEGLSGSEITAGQEIFSLKATADYMLSDKFRFSAFYDQRLTNPYISNNFATANYNVGFSLTFTL